MIATKSGLRVALFTDCFHETNGVGTLCRAYADYARQCDMPFFCAYGAAETSFQKDGSVHELRLRRGPLSFWLDAGMLCDPLLSRHRALAVARLRDFRPDVVHITGPGDVSILGLWASNLVGAPAVASWHTNVHEYAHRRLQVLLSFLPRFIRDGVSDGAGKGTLKAAMSFYRVAHFVTAPNQDMVNLLTQRTGRPAFLMAHGVNTELFTPCRRSRTDSRFCIGYVGRLTPEKNVRALVELERTLLAAGERQFRMLIVGEGSEREWLQANLQHADFAGVLRGDALANAFANMDAFVFPSLTDTFGLVILEAMSSGVPVIVTPQTGLRAAVTDGINGFLTDDLADGVRRLMRCGVTHHRMGVAARLHACSREWSEVFDDLHRIYRDGLNTEDALRRKPTPKFDLPSRGRVSH